MKTQGNMSLLIMSLMPVISVLLILPRSFGRMWTGIWLSPHGLKIMEQSLCYSVARNIEILFLAIPQKVRTTSKDCRPILTLVSGTFLVTKKSKWSSFGVIRKTNGLWRLMIRMMLGDPIIGQFDELNII